MNKIMVFAFTLVILVPLKEAIAETTPQQKEEMNALFKTYLPIVNNSATAQKRSYMMNCGKTSGWGKSSNMISGPHPRFIIKGNSTFQFDDRIKDLLQYSYWTQTPVENFNDGFFPGEDYLIHSIQCCVYKKP